MSLSLTEHLAGKALVQFLWQSISKTSSEVKNDPNTIKFLHQSTDTLESNPVPDAIIPIAQALGIQEAWLALRPNGEHSIILHYPSKDKK